MTNIILRSKDGEIAPLVSVESFRATYSPREINKRLRVAKTTKDLIKVDSNSIVLCRKAFGDDLIVDTVEAMVINLVDSFNLKYNLNADQVLELVEIIISDYYFISITELAYIFRKGKKGDYGSLHGSLNIENITGWIDAYRESRIGEFMTANERNHDLTKSGKEIFTDEEGNTKIRDRQSLPPQLVPYLKKMSEHMPQPKSKSKDYDPNLGSEFIEPNQNEELKRQKEELKKRFPDQFKD